MSVSTNSVGHCTQPEALASRVLGCVPEPFCASSPLIFHLPAWVFAPCSLPSHSLKPSGQLPSPPLCLLIWLDLTPPLSSFLATLFALLMCLELDHLMLGTCLSLPCVFLV